MRVLVTGSAGQVAQVFIRAHTAPDATSGLEFRALDVVPTEGVADSIIGDISDEAAVVKAAEGCDAIVHLTHGGGNSAPWEQALKVDYIGTYNVFEAAVRCGCSRVVYASRAGVMSGFGPEAPYAMDETRTVHMTPKPVGYYSVSKVFGESLGYMYATQHPSLSVVCVRIGNFNKDRPDPEHPHHLGHADSVRCFTQALLAPLAPEPRTGVRHEVVYGVSDSSWPLYDLEHGRQRIGYDPQQRSEIPESEWKPQQQQQQPRL